MSAVLKVLSCIRTSEQRPGTTRHPTTSEVSIFAEPLNSEGIEQRLVSAVRCERERSKQLPLPPQASLTLKTS